MSINNRREAWNNFIVIQITIITSTSIIIWSTNFGEKVKLHIIDENHIVFVIEN